MSQFTEGVQVAAAAAETAAPVVGMFNPAIGVAMTLLTPIAANFLVGVDKMVIEFRKDMTPEEVIAALQPSKSKFWPEPPSIEPVKP